MIKTALAVMRKGKGCFRNGIEATFFIFSFRMLYLCFTWEKYKL